MSIPADEEADTVEVIKAKVDFSHVPWHGAVLLGVLDFARDAWVQQEDWLDGGVKVGDSRKYSIPCNVSSQLFWFSTV